MDCLILTWGPSCPRCTCAQIAVEATVAARRPPPKAIAWQLPCSSPVRGLDGRLTFFPFPFPSPTSAAWVSAQDFVRTSGRIQSRMERRRYPRRALDRPAKIFVPDGDVLPCRIRNVSRGGVKLSVGWKGWLPAGFYLQDAFTGVRRAVQVVWRGISGIGVRFTRVRVARTQETGFGHRHR